MDKQTINMLHKEVIKEVCAPTQTDLSYYKYVKHTTHKRVKELYQHQWSYGVIQTVDHRERLGEDVRLLIVGVYELKTHNSFLY